MSKVFLSCSLKDENFVKEFYRRLTREGVEFFLIKNLLPEVPTG